MAPVVGANDKEGAQPAVGVASEAADVVIVGAGPSGMATALSMAKLGFKKVVVLERLPGEWDPDWVKSSCYRIDFHGQRWFELMGILDDLAAAAVLYDYMVNIMDTKGNIKTVPRADRTFFHAAYFITRMKLLKLLKSKIETSDFAGCIEMRFDTSVSDIVPAPKGSDGFLVSAEPKDGKPYVITAQLLVGASGVRTPVNQVMKQINKRFGRAVVTYLNAGRRRKALRLNVPASVVPACALTQIMGKDRGFMVIFPQHADEPRVATTVFDQLDYENGDALIAYLKDNYPQLSWDDILEKDLADSFATHPGLFTSQVMHVTRLQVTSGNAGACLVGDAVHIAPPDLAQGINSAFDDVAALHEAVAKGMAQNATAAKMVRIYEKDHLGSAQAVAKLLPLGFPYQYKHPDNLKKKLFFFDFNLRKKASAVLPLLYSPPVIQLLQDPSKSYGDCVRLHKRTTRNFFLTAVAGAAVVAGAAAGLASLVLKAVKKGS